MRKSQKLARKMTQSVADSAKYQHGKLRFGGTSLEAGVNRQLGLA